jgi:hypothetical protein
MAHGSFDRQQWRRDAPSGSAMAPTLARRPGGYDEPFLKRSSPTGAELDDELT